MKVTKEDILNMPIGSKLLLKKSSLCNKVKDVIMIKESVDSINEHIKFKALDGYCKTHCHGKNGCKMSFSSLDGRNIFDLMNRNKANK